MEHSFVRYQWLHYNATSATITIMVTTQGIKLDDDTRKRLRALAEKKQHSPHWLMRTAIEDYLQREEKYEEEKAEDMARWENYLLTGEAISNDKVKEWLEDLSEGKKISWQNYL
jgi:predicted transcriptional regulator